jgi:heterodisulfide reductase subunit C
MSQHTAEERHGTGETWEEVQEKIMTCMQCGTCSGSCSASFAMDHTPRQLWRMVQRGLHDDVFRSRTFSMCTSCYYCTLRCPRGLPLTEAIHALKKLAYSRGITEKKSASFYRIFLDTVRRYGRVREMELMTRYFLAVKSPVLPLSFAPLGLRLMGKGKVDLELPQFFGPGKLDALYKKVEEMEAAP